MTAENILVMATITVGLFVLIVSFIPECILINYDGFKNAPMVLKIYIIIHLVIIIAGVLYISWIKPPEVYYYGL